MDKNSQTAPACGTPTGNSSCSTPSAPGLPAKSSDGGEGIAVSSLIPDLPDGELLNIQKPAQYLGGELNSITKCDSEVDVHFALAFPDTYEVGMSHLGLQILYEILNNDQKTWAERAYMPMADMEDLMRERQLPLCSLESKRRLSDFDLLGFSLQYELCGTNILAMLELGRIPFFAADRIDGHPIVIGGGPYAYHPEALSPFFDAFLLGDAEEAVLDVVNAVRAAKREGESRTELLTRLHRIEGVYVPSMFEPIFDDSGVLLRTEPKDPERKVVVRRLLPTLEGVPTVEKPVVPNIRTIHNRLSVEVMRGCVRGCRFCQAGYLYRPQRERSPQEILKIIETALPQSGYEEVSLLSLSTADYCSVVPLLKTIMDKYAENDRLSVSFPSTRVDALTPEVLEQVQRVRRTGFTVAPEGGSQRLRDVINKGVTDEEILNTVQNVFRMGWSGIKLYFILGLPTETDEDLQGIIDLAQKIRRLPDAKGKEVTVSVSTLVPKPHTPFQWAEQITPEETIRKQRYLAEGLRKVGATFRCHDHVSTLLEGVFCRAGRELAPAVVRAYELGARRDAWQDELSEEIWMQAFQDCNIDPYFYLRPRKLEEALPWDHLSCGIPKHYFAKEYQRATREKTTPDCLTESCSTCGACNYDTRKNILFPRDETETAFQASPPEDSVQDASNDPVCRMRIVYEKSGTLRFSGHLELVSVFFRAARRAEIPLSFSQGFHPLPRLVFGPPTQLGIASDEELVDFYLSEVVEPEALLARLNGTLPEGLKMKSATPLQMHEPGIQEDLISMSYRVRCLSPAQGPFGRWLQSTQDDVSSFVDEVKNTKIVRSEKAGKARRKRGGNEKSFLLGEHIGEIRIISPQDQVLEFELLFDATRASPRPAEIVAAITEMSMGEVVLEKIATKLGRIALTPQVHRKAQSAPEQPSQTNDQPVH